MEKIKVDTNAVVYENLDELSKEDSILIQKATEAIQSSYAPYSNFKVGACILLENGEYVLASNQENAAYPSGMCAERVAIWKASTSFPGIKMVKIAITVSTNLKKVDKPVGPCGACRQSMLEFETKQQKPIEVLFMGEVGKIIKVQSVVSLLPFSFDNSYL